MSVHIIKCVHGGRVEWHLRYPGMTEQAAQALADDINSGKFMNEQQRQELAELRAYKAATETWHKEGDTLCLAAENWRFWFRIGKWWGERPWFRRA